MEFDGFDCDEGNRAKRCKHGLALDEIESVFAGAVLVLPDRERSQSEERFRAIGIAASARKVFIAFTMREGAIRPISARYMHRREIESYEKAYPDFQKR